MDPVRIAGLDVGFSITKPSAGIGVWADNRLELTNCHGVEACAQISAAGDYDIVAIDGRWKFLKVHPRNISECGPWH
jgi:hypothetical protein